MSKSSNPLDNCNPEGPKFSVASPHDLSARANWLRQFFFKGMERTWKNDYMPFTTGAPWGDRVWHEGDYYIVPEAMGFMGIKGEGVFGTSLLLMADKVNLPDGFWELSLPERRAIFFREVMINYAPHEIVSSNDLLAGGRFNTQLSKCLNDKEFKAFSKQNIENRQKNTKFL